MIQITVFENINLSGKYVENIAKNIEFIRLFFYNKSEIINLYIYSFFFTLDSNSASFQSIVTKTTEDGKTIFSLQNQ